MKKLLSLSVLTLLVATACHHSMRAEVKGSGNRQTQKREIAPFTSISAEGAFTIEVVCQKDVGLEVEGDDNVLPLVTTEVSSNVLHLNNSKSYAVNQPIVVRISVPNLEGLTVNGAGKLDITQLENERFEIDANGAPSINVSGSTKLVDIDTNGAAKIDTHNLRAARAVVDSKGVSKIDLGVSDQLDVTVSGPSQVTYRGDPVVNKTIHGPGKIEKRRNEGA
jgi:hypothetical protein